MNELTNVVNGFFPFKKQIINEQAHSHLKELATKQNPETLIISCSDSRVDPAILLNAELGELFVIRNVANIVPPFQNDNHSTYHGTSAALEFAIKILQVKNIIVIGHSNCGGIKALVENEENGDSAFDYILDWVFILKDAKIKTQNIKNKEEQYHQCEKMGIRISLENLKTFPFVKEKLENNTLNLYGLYFSIKDMSLEYFDENQNTFYTVRNPEKTSRKEYRKRI